MKCRISHQLTFNPSKIIKVFNVLDRGDTYTLKYDPEEDKILSFQKGTYHPHPISGSFAIDMIDPDIPDAKEQIKKIMEESRKDWEEWKEDAEAYWDKHG